MSKVLKYNKPLHRFFGYLRYLRGTCPRCNLDGPEVDRCVVCRYLPNGEICDHLSVHLIMHKNVRLFWWRKWQMYPEALQRDPFKTRGEAEKDYLRNYGKKENH